MKSGWGSKAAAGIAGAAAIGAAVGGALAQEDGGLVINGSVRFGAEFDDNGLLEEESPGNDQRFTTDLRLGVLSDTPSSTLALSFGASLVEEDLADRTGRSGFVDPFVGLNYATDGADSNISFSGQFRRTDLSNRLVDDLGTDFIEDDLIISGGELDRTTIGAEASFGLTSPLGATLSYDLSDRNYSDDADPDLFDRTTQTVRFTGFAQILDNARMRAFVSYRDYEADDDEQTERTTQSYGVGVLYEINPVLTFDGEVSFDTVEETTDVLGAPVTTENDGLGVDATLSQQLANGTVSFLASREIRNTGNLSELRVRRSMDLRDGALSFSLGVSAVDREDPVLVGGIDWARELPRGRISVAFNRTEVINDDDETRVRTNASIGYLHDINPVSSFDTRFGLARSELLDTNEETTNADLTLTYRRQVTQDWDWRLGYRGRYREDEDGDSGTSNTFFTSFGRSFSIRP